MKIKFIKSILVPTSGILTVGVVSPILASSCGEQSLPVESIQLNKSELELDVGKTEQLTVTISPENASNKKVTWKSNNVRVATVDQTGLVTAVGPGEATITAKTVDGDKPATCKVTAKSVPVSGIKLDKTKLELVVGETEQLTATISPEDATNKNVVWSSSVKRIASVDQNGKVTAISLGEATITVTTKDGKQQATCQITVKEKN